MLLPIVFIVVSAAVLGFAVLTVTARNMFNAALCLVGALFGVAGLFVLLETEFLAVVQVMVYVGAIATLIVFAIMLSRDMMRRDIRGTNEQWIEGLVAATLLFALLAVLVARVDWPEGAALVKANRITDLGIALVGEYVIPFEVASVVLLVGMIGAIIIARERE